MGEGIELIHLPLKDVLSGAAYSHVDDRHAIARTSEEKTRALATNPFRASPEDPGQILALCDGCVVGRIDLMPGELRRNGEKVRCVWISHLFVVPEYRGHGVATRIMSEVPLVHHTIGGCGISAMSRRLYRNLGWQDLDLPRYVTLESALKLLPPSMRLGVDQRLRHWRAAEGRRVMTSLHELVCRDADSMPADWDQWLGNTSGGVAGARSSQWINWLLRNEFVGGRRARNVLLLFEDRKGDPAGYVLGQVKHVDSAASLPLRSFKSGVIQDWRTCDSAKLSAQDMIAVCASALEKCGADVVSVCARDAGLSMMRLGCVRYGAVQARFMLRNDSPLYGEKVADSHWCLTSADGDNFFS